MRRSAAPRARRPTLNETPERELAGRIRTGEENELHSLLIASPQHVNERVRDSLDVGARPQHVIAAPVERQMRRAQCERGFELLLEDGPHELAPDREIRIADRRPDALAHPCAVRSAQPRTDPSGSSSPTPSVNESPIATKRTSSTGPA